MKLTFSILKGYFFKSKFISIIFLLSTLSLGIIISSLTIYINYLEDNVINKTVNSLGVSNKNIWLNNTNASLSEDYLANKSELIEELVNQESGFITDNSKIIKLDISKNKSPLKNIIYKKNVSQHSSSIKDYSLSVVTIDNLFENVSILDSTDENKEGVFNIYISKSR